MPNSTEGTANISRIALVELVHAMTPNISILRNSALSSISEIPGIGYVAESRKGYKTKSQSLEGALSLVGNPQLLRTEKDKLSFQKLRFDYGRVKDCVVRNGGPEVFGDWANWGDVCPLRSSRQPYNIERPILLPFGLYRCKVGTR